jgi:hypothetical protein
MGAIAPSGTGSATKQSRGSVQGAGLLRFARNDGETSYFSSGQYSRIGLSTSSLR